MKLPRSLALAALAAASCRALPRAIPEHEATTPVPNSSMAERTADLARLAAGSDAKVIFLGDSITQGWEDGGHEAWHENFTHRGALNLGVSGDRTEHVLWRFRQGHYDGLHPRLVVMMIGTNNTGHRMDAPTKVADGIESILREIDSRWSSPHVLLLAIFPRGERAGDSMRLNNAAVNDLIRPLVDGSRVEWLDIGPMFLSADGSARKELLPDLLHLSPQGYALWAKAILPVVEMWCR